MFGAAVQAGQSAYQGGRKAVEAKGIPKDAAPAIQDRIHRGAGQAVTQYPIFPNLNPNLGSAWVVIQGVANGRDNQRVPVGVQVSFVNSDVMNGLIGVHQAGYDGLFFPGGVHVHIGAAGRQEPHEKGQQAQGSWVEPEWPNGRGEVKKVQGRYLVDRGLN